MQIHPIIQTIRQSNYLPEIPKVFGETLNMLLEPYEYDMDAFIGKISGLPNMESTLIQALNYSTKLNRKFLTLKDAVLYLGANNTKMIVIAYITRLLLPNKNGRAKKFDKRKYWKHCIGTSIASFLISDKTGLCDMGKMFTYGLIHDIGITVLDICLPDLLDDIYTLHMQKGTHQIIAEKIVLGGITHAEIGMWICKEWGLPEEIVEVVGYHHAPFVKGKTSNEVLIMHLADSVSASYYENLIGIGNTFLYADKSRDALDLSKEFIDDMAEKLPMEIDKVIRFGIFEF
ncbi:MAG: HDOD domain-containing protein [Clostridiaceae bacterium]|nr:HDOD domain-containing protein [Clostridiaceae bacterium]